MPRTPKTEAANQRPSTEAEPSMAYEVVARRWRPLTFDSVVGQRHVTATLASAIERDRVAHAFLFTGIRGVGKTTAARLLARALNCTNRKGAEPCNECSSCKQILDGASVDVLEIDGASNRGIEEVRSLIDAAQYRPAGSRYRIYIIDEVHQLTREAFNALLKILEEPPDHVKFVLATTEPHKLPPTVLSRCQRYDFRRLGVEEISRHLAHIAEADGLEVGPEALALLAREADGSMRDAQSLLEQVVAAKGGPVELSDVSEILGVAGSDLVLGCVEAILTNDAKRVVELASRIRSGGYDSERFLSELLDVVRDVAVANVAGTDVLGDAVGDSTRAVIEKMAKQRSQLDLQRIFKSLLSTAEDLRRGSLPELVLEMGLLKAASLESVLSAAEVLARLERIDGGRSGSGATSAGSAAGTSGRPSAGRSGGTGQRTSSPQQPGRGAEKRAWAERDARDETKGATSPRAGVASAAAVRDAGDETKGTAAPRAGVATTAPDTAPPDDDEPAIEDDADFGQRPSAADIDSGLAAGAGGDQAQTAGWERFLKQIQERGGFDLYVTLSNCEVTELTDKVLEVHPMLASFRRKLEEPAALARIRAVAADCFGADIDVRIGNGEKKPEQQGMSVQSIEEQRQTKMEGEALEDPLVRAALDVLGGKVEKISRLED
jgi:DNA polymerase-3 subunit gamma/tau